MLRRYECVPIFFLLGLSILLTFKAEPLMRYTQATAQSLNNPEQLRDGGHGHATSAQP